MATKERERSRISPWMARSCFMEFRRHFLGIYVKQMWCKIISQCAMKRAIRRYDETRHGTLYGFQLVGVVSPRGLKLLYGETLLWRSRGKNLTVRILLEVSFLPFRVHCCSPKILPRQSWNKRGWCHRPRIYVSYRMHTRLRIWNV